MDFLKMMKQAKDLQGKMAEMQQQIAEIEVEGSAGAGLVTATLSGKGELKALKIDPSLAKPEEIEILEDLVMAAVNDARGKSEEVMQEKTKEMMGGMGLPPGMKMPF
ncbi:YbaB/EbfC family nucleoid-associated protein [Rhodobium gokarnense]|uniref:Nucleoid-associated protein M2319_004486 n=1 Tax=Rhodobium gokarnense TaxID=364296 RepID=A0ABT3HI85_9HYPH|nr:YbaB/EbfC family nucleoid-associated protein [Rhodobium gokarnense]MCW2310121.1 DNA-binding YbaB/EbfC family protein [Rhodobium gokarnense]